MSVTIWMEPGLRVEVPPDRRSKANREIDGKPWTRAMFWAREHPGVWVWLCTTDRPEGICHRVRTGKYPAVRHGTWEITQRHNGDGLSNVYLCCLDPVGEPT